MTTSPPSSASARESALESARETALEPALKPVCEAVRSPLLSVKDFTQHFRINRRLTIRAVNGISFDVAPGEIFGLVGESGSGKSTVARAIMGITPPTGGEILFRGNRISDRQGYRQHRQDVQRNIQVIFQDSAAALNPRMRVADIVSEPLRINNIYPTHERTQAEVDSLLHLVGLDAHYAAAFPGELSGGQRQRVAIARAIAVRPKLIVADEPVASLDVSIQAQIIALFQHLQRDHGFAFLFIAHDLAMVRFVCHRVGVMLAGKLVEVAPAEALFTTPRHPYTQALISAMPIPDPIRERSKTVLHYTPSPEKTNGRDLIEVAPGHWVADF